MNLIALENEILNNRFDKRFLEEQQMMLVAQKKVLDQQIEEFLEAKCDGVTGLRNIDLDTKNPIYRYYNHKQEEYSKVERMIRIIQAYLK